MSPKLAVGLAMFIGGLATQLGTVDTWTAISGIKFVSAILFQVSGFILSVWGGIETKPPRNGRLTRSTDDVDKKEMD